MTKDEKLRIARQLERLKVDVIEAGFAASSNGDFEAVQQIAQAIKESTVCSLSRANDRDIARAAEALKGAARSRIHTFIATSPLHMEKKLRMTPEQVLEQAKQAVRFARNLCADIEFSAEDGYRSELPFLARVVEAVIAEGATIDELDTSGLSLKKLRHIEGQQVDIALGDGGGLKGVSAAGSATSKDPKMVALREVIERLNDLFGDGEYAGSSVRGRFTAHLTTTAPAPGRRPPSVGKLGSRFVATKRAPARTQSAAAARRR